MSRKSLADRNCFSAIIAGGGPAGSAAAIELGREGHRVLVVERSHYTDWRVGETLPPEIRQPLMQLGLWGRFVSAGHAPSDAIHSVWGTHDVNENDFLFNPYGQGWHVDRSGFDAMLAAEAESTGAVIMRKSRIAEITGSPGCWQVTVSTPSGVQQAEASFLVDATGRGARIARTRGAGRLVYDQLIGLIGRLAPSGNRPKPAPILLLEASEQGWWYSVPLPDGSMLAAYMTDADYLARAEVSPSIFWNERMHLTGHIIERLHGFRLTEDIRVQTAGTSRLSEFIGPGWVSAGDSACAYDPLSADGIHKALRQGLDAGRAICKYLGGERRALDQYAEGIAAAFRRYLHRRYQYYALEGRWPNSQFWLRRHAAKPNAD